MLALFYEEKRVKRETLLKKNNTNSPIIKKKIRGQTHQVDIT